MSILESVAGVAILATIFGLKPEIFVAVVAGIGVPLVSFLGGAIWWFHKRVKQLEQTSEDREAVVYGGENNPLNIGLVKEVKTLKQDLADANEIREELREKQQEILDRLESIENKLDKYNGHGDDD